MSLSDSGGPFDHLTDSMRAMIKAKLLPPEPVFTGDELQNFGVWMAATGMRPEGQREFNLDKYPYQKELYDEDRTHYRARVAIMKAAQTGLTVKLLSRAMWWTADVKRQINVGLGFPTKEAVEVLSATRFRPQLYSSARMIQLLRDVNRVSVQQLGISNMRFLGLISGVTADSNPLDIELLDEVRLVPERTVERFMVRISESTLIHPSGVRGAIELNSTAGFPKKDIHRYFMDSTQGWWAVRCPDLGCLKHLTGIILPQEFAQRPGRIVRQDGSGRYYLCCPRCGARIDDAAVLNGFYIHENPGAEWIGYQFSQLVKGESFLNSDIMPAWNRNLNVPEFYNSRLGLPYMDAEAVPAPIEIIEACCDITGVKRWLSPEDKEGGVGRDGRWRSMGIDQRAPEKHYVIKSLLGNGLEDFDAVGVIEASGDDAANQIAELAKKWGCNIVVIDGEPSYDLAIMVANRLPKRMVWFADYNSTQDDIARFQDKRSDKSIKRGSGELKYEQVVQLNRYKVMDWELGKWARQQVRLPARADLYEGSKMKRTLGGIVTYVSAFQEYAEHISGMARYKAQKTERLSASEPPVPVPGEYVLKWRSMEVDDPHYLHASLFSSIGLHYRKQMSHIDTGETDPVSEKPAPQQLDAAAAGGPLLASVTEQLAEGRAYTCGTCAFLKAAPYGGGVICGHEAQGIGTVRVKDTDPACEMHETRLE